MRPRPIHREPNGELPTKVVSLRVMGPGLAPAAAEKKASAEGRGGSVMVGRGGGAVPESVLGVDIGGRWMATK